MLNQISAIHEKIRFSALGVLKNILAVMLEEFIAKSAYNKF